MIDLSIIVVSWNSREDLAVCLPSISSAAAAHTFEVIVVDNASTDGSLDYVQSVMPESICRSNASNRGFAAANNQGIALSHGRYFLLLNPDTFLHRAACDSLVQFMDLHPGVSACGPALLNADGSPQRTGVRFPSLWNLCVEALFVDRLFPHTRLFGRHRELYADPGVPRAVDFVQGSCLLVRGETADRVGVLDESFFMYFEETDWCKRMKQAGGEVWYVPAAQVVHFGGGTFAHYDEKRLVAYHRSLLHFFHKHCPSWQGPVLRCILAVRSLVRLAVWGLLSLLTRHERHTRSRSALRGYMKTLALLLQRGGDP